MREYGKLHQFTSAGVRQWAATHGLACRCEEVDDTPHGIEVDLIRGSGDQQWTYRVCLQKFQSELGRLDWAAYALVNAAEWLRNQSLDASAMTPERLQETRRHALAAKHSTNNMADLVWGERVLELLDCIDKLRGEYVDK